MLLIAEEGAGSSAVILIKTSNQIWDLREDKRLLPNGPKERVKVRVQMRSDTTESIAGS